MVVWPAVRAQAKPPRGHTEKGGGSGGATGVEDNTHHCNMNFDERRSIDSVLPLSIISSL